MTVDLDCLEAWSESHGYIPYEQAKTIIAELRSLQARDAGVTDEIARLREALKPFANEADDWSPESNSGDLYPDSELVDCGGLKVGDLRRARAALQVPVTIAQTKVTEEMVERAACVLHPDWENVPATKYHGTTEGFRRLKEARRLCVRAALEAALQVPGPTEAQHGAAKTADDNASGGQRVEAPRSETLLACPFCGGAPEKHPDYPYVGCTVCPAVQNSVEAWNGRTTPPRSPENPDAARDAQMRRRGAEEMREAAARLAEQMSEHIVAADIRYLPLPGDA